MTNGTIKPVKTAEQTKKRSHSERLADLRVSFEKCKARANATGSINECSLEKVRKQVNVSDSYFYGKDRVDQAIHARYQKIREDVDEFKKTFKGTDGIKEQTALGEAILERNNFEKERDEAHFLTAKITEKNKKLIDDLNNYRRQKEETENNAIAIAASQVNSNTSRSNVVSFNEPKIISPDDFLVDKDNNYDYSNQTKIDNAWRSAKHKLKESILNTRISMRIYMLIGVQNSGKTEWRENRNNFFLDRQPIVIDATNLTVAKRSEFFLEIMKVQSESKKDIKVCAVFFDVPLLQLIQRNKERPATKRLPDQLITDNYNRIESPTTSELFDEIIIVRQ
ncbi:hypothetical protein Q4493_00305 [Colwellia sp. 1_MG-2023]|uniref:hypothetical protein n=1 Tax=Colwellia sp. 1_MG-2023 TaxID=3062649 RepID=UPI0026E2BBEA|nr:hypothetical protein [Colwellia sp. 1_MG-2023]MDO6444205.1 hypothetical protein [Colwellia sp. 1_MG-2023]